MRVNSPGPPEEEGAGIAAASGAAVPPDCGFAAEGAGAAGALIELNIRVKAPGSAGCCDPARAGSAGTAGAGGWPGDSASSFFCMETWLKTCETPGAGLDAAAGAFCSIAVRVCNMRVNSPGPDFGAAGGAVGAAATGGSAGFSAPATGVLGCLRSEASRSSSLAAGAAETCPKIPVALAGSPAEGSAPRNSGFSFGFFEDSMCGHPGFKNRAFPHSKL